MQRPRDAGGLGAAPGAGDDAGVTEGEALYAQLHVCSRRYGRRLPAVLEPEGEE